MPFCSSNTENDKSLFFVVLFLASFINTSKQRFTQNTAISRRAADGMTTNDAGIVGVGGGVGGLFWKYERGK